MATAYTPHPCTMQGQDSQLRCEGLQCGDTDKGERYQGVCDKDGCDINPFRMGNETFYGRGPAFAVDTTRPMTVVTQFLTDDGTDDGDLSEIRRFYVQGGRIVHSPPSTILGPKNSDSITDDFCMAKKTLFGDVNDFQTKGGNRAMGESLDRGQVLALSLWDDVEVNMLWLDSAYPLDKPTTAPGVRRGMCPGGESSTPTYVRKTYPDGYVKFANAAIGEINSTLIGSTLFPFPTTPPPPCVERCSEVPGQSTPECNGQARDRCLQMSRYENKCLWIECPSTSSSTPPAATTTTSTKLGECKSFCAQSQDSWSFKCSWDCCTGCKECAATTTTTTTGIAASTTAPPLSQVCKSWCAGNAKPWVKKCTWEKCRGCAECVPLRRRLSVDAEHPTHAFLV